MLSKAKLKYVKSLQLKKYRKAEQRFIVEGTKSVTELLDSDFPIVFVAATDSFIDSHRDVLVKKKIEVIEVSGSELAATGVLQTNEAAIAVASMRTETLPPKRTDEFTVVLDDIRDPGNLGTIIRTCDWYGIRIIVASPETSDFYNPKTIAASMGSFTRVEVFYTELGAYLDSSSCVYGTFLDGSDVHRVSFASGGYIVIGNESHGISPEVARLVTDRISIPRVGGAESLNAAVACAVVLDNLRRSHK